MLPFRKILFPIDYSEPCQAVVPYVKEMLRRFSAELTVVHAYGGEALAFSELPLIDPKVAEEARAGEERRLREFVQETFPGQHVESIAELGEAGTVIHKIVQTQGTDLVMLATHGRGPVRRFLVGSVAAKVLHDVSAAVWTGTSSYLTEHAPRLPYRSLLCAVDDREEAVGRAHRRRRTGCRVPCFAQCGSRDRDTTDGDGSRLRFLPERGCRRG